MTTPRMSNRLSNERVSTNQISEILTSNIDFVQKTVKLGARKLLVLTERDSTLNVLKALT